VREKRGNMNQEGKDRRSRRPAAERERSRRNLIDQLERENSFIKKKKEGGIGFQSGILLFSRKKPEREKTQVEEQKV